MSASSSWYLKRLDIDAFGAFAQRAIGPFAPGMNVVYGPNEAGKSTINAFVGGVLFGWERSGGQKNSYKPSASERSGTLVFAPRGGEGPTIECFRARNAEGIKPDADPVVLDDIDKETYEAIFALNSDELGGLRRTSDITARLLTAGSGTGASPSHALAEIERMLSEDMSKASAFPDSHPNLQAALGDVRERIGKARSEAEHFKRQSRELGELQPRLADISAALSQMNGEIENLMRQRDTLAKLDARRDDLQQRRQSVQEESRVLAAQRREQADHGTAAHLSIDAVDEQALRDAIEDMQQDVTRLEHALALARETYAATSASYEALEEADDIQQMRQKVRQQRRLQVALSIILPVVFAGLGVPVFIRGREISSLSVTALGAVLIVFSLFIAVAAVVMLFRPNKVEEAMGQRLQDAQWVMLQDGKKAEACQKSLDECRASIRQTLDDSGLEAAQGSLRRARALLDETREARAAADLLGQKRQSLASQLSMIDGSLAADDRERQAALDALGMVDEVPVAVLDDLIAQKTAKRADQQKTSESMNARLGELRQDLANARHLKQLDAYKLEEQMIRTRMGETDRDIARLLLARRMLAAAVTSWESKSQPKVYQQASSLFSLMTDGAWEQVRIGSSGGIEAVDALDRVRPPELLSLGTCQQLYLALRLALLMEADNVGRSIPILADDILVNFDAQRRKGAARALCRLAETRQVIMFTCHTEIAELMQETCDEPNMVRL